MYRLFPTSDGFLCVTAVGDSAFRRLCRAIGADDIAADERFADELGRRKHRAELGAALEAWFADSTTTDAFERLDAAGVACEPVAAESYLPELFFQQWALDAERVFEHEHPAHGPIREVGLVTNLSATPARKRGPNALLGANTREILAELGYTGENIDGMTAAGVCVEAGPGS